MKNTKIMAVLVVLLAAMLFTGAASAAAVSEENFNNLTANVTSLTAAATHESPDILIYNTTTWASSNDYDVWIDWGDDTRKQVTLNAGAAFAKGYNATVNHTYAKPGIYTVTLYNASTPTDTTKSKTLATITVVNAKDVKKDGYAFVYEYIYVPGATTLTKYSEGTNPTAVKQIAGTKGLFYLTESVVGGQYGAYYYKGAPGSTSPSEYIYIWYPELTIQAELTDPDTTWGATAGDSIDGKTINKDTNVTFLVNTPMVGPVNVNDRFDELAVKIVFTTPVGGKTTVFGTLQDGTVANYNDVDVTATQNVAGSAIPGIDAVAGTYTAQAEFINYAPFANNAEKSNTISFTVQSTSMSLSADKDSVIRSNPFTVTIQGSANTVYFVYIEGSDDNQPYLLPSQSGYQAHRLLRLHRRQR